MIEIDRYNNSLLCPRSFEYLHQQTVTSQWRHKEDGPGVEHKSSQKGISIMDVESKDIHGRRDSLVIDFYCETCDTNHALRIHQHKGNTIMEWIEE